MPRISRWSIFHALVLLLLVLPVDAWAQKPKNRIIIWDVTKSMIGEVNGVYSANHDFDKQVREGIKRVIQTSSDNSGEIRIIRFRERVLDNELFRNDPAGRANAGKFVDDFIIYHDSKSAGNTNICGAWQQAFEYVDLSKENILYLFTDGEQNVKDGPFGVQCLSHLIETYCKLTQGSQTFTFFVTLDVNNQYLNNQIKNACSKNLALFDLTEVKKNGIPDLLNAQAMFDTLVINLQDETPFATERFRVEGGSVPKDFKVATRFQLQENIPLDIKSRVRVAEEGTIDVDYVLDDVNGTTIKKLREVLTNPLWGVLTLTNATPSNPYINVLPTAVRVVIENKRPQTLNFNIK